MAKAKSPVPEGFHSVTPQLILDNAAEAIDWYKKGLGAEEKGRAVGPDGKILHAELRIGNSIIMTSDDTPQTVLETVREKAFKYVHKPIEALALLQTVREVLAAAEPPPVEVISARPEWVELVVPCTREAAERIQVVMAQLDTDLPSDLRDTIGYAFRELLLNAVEWGGRLDPKRKVRIACLRTQRM